MTTLASHNERQYVRQQGLPVNGTLTANRNRTLPNSLFIGEPGLAPYDGEQNRLGYALTHRFDSGWTLNQNIRWQTLSLTGTLVSAETMAVNSQLLNRGGTQQDFSGTTIGMDANPQRRIDLAGTQHEITLGVDYNRSTEIRLQRTCNVAALNVYQPVYGAAVNCPSAYSLSSEDNVSALGFSARDQMRFAWRWLLTAGLRHDTARTNSTDRLLGARTEDTARAVTGNAGLMFDLTTWARPYISYATSFLPNSGTDVDGSTFKPETGRQAELGIKFDLPNKSGLLTLAMFDLTRRNVLSSDPVNTDFSIATGEQRTRGLEAELTADLGGG